MEATKITIRLSVEYIVDSADFGMLDLDTIAQVLCDELDQRIIKLVDAEVKAHRAERRTNRDSSLQSEDESTRI